LFLLGAALFLSQNLRAQTPEAAASAATPSFLRYGLFGGVAVNNHFANFSEFAGLTTEVGFPFGNTDSLVSYYIGGLVEVPIIDRFGVALRASVANVGGFSLSVRENFLGATSRVFTGAYILASIGVILHFPQVRAVSYRCIYIGINSLPLLSGEPYLTYRVPGRLNTLCWSAVRVSC
jgi:hypothetical protein